MKILFISSYVDPATGASILARITEKLKQDGHEVRVITTARGFDTETTRSVALPGVLDVIDRIINKIIPNYFSMAYFRLLDEVFKFDPDVINIHWTHSIRPIPIHAIPKLCEKYPVFWTMHDLWPVTTNSFFEFSGGNSLVAPDSTWIRRIVKHFSFSPEWLFKYKVWLLNNVCIHTISPSRWLFNKVNSSPVFRSSCNHYVPNGVDIEIFKPKERSVLRETYGIDKDEKVILFLSADVSDKRKGFYYFAKAIQRLREVNPDLANNTTVILVGENGNYVNKYLPVKILNLGGTRSQSRLVEYYCLADVFVSASLADNFPSTSLESLACGTPIVAFDVGGVSEIVVDKKTGLLAESKNIIDLSSDIEELLVNSELRKEMGESGRSYVANNFNMDKCVSNYINLFRSEEEAARLSK